MVILTFIFTLRDTIEELVDQYAIAPVDKDEQERSSLDYLEEEDLWTLDVINAEEWEEAALDAEDIQ